MLNLVLYYAIVPGLVLSISTGSFVSFVHLFSASRILHMMVLKK
jgi:hypothetical protein